MEEQGKVLGDAMAAQVKMAVEAEARKIIRSIVIETLLESFDGMSFEQNWSGLVYFDCDKWRDNLFEMRDKP